MTKCNGTEPKNTVQITPRIHEILEGIEGLESALMILDQIDVATSSIEEIRSVFLCYVFILTEELTRELRGE